LALCGLWSRSYLLLSVSLSLSLPPSPNPYPLLYFDFGGDYKTNATQVIPMIFCLKP
jgi:hypothetical protein